MLMRVNMGAPSVWTVPCKVEAHKDYKAENNSRPLSGRFTTPHVLGLGLLVYGNSRIPQRSLVHGQKIGG